MCKGKIIRINIHKVSGLTNLSTNICLVCLEAKLRAQSHQPFLDWNSLLAQKVHFKVVAVRRLSLTKCSLNANSDQLQQSQLVAFS